VRTCGKILDQLRVKDYVLFPASDPSRLFDHKDELYDQVQNGDQGQVIEVTDLGGLHHHYIRLAA
jgi:hypothetical protein